jgi:hypothetical protein
MSMNVEAEVRHLHKDLLAFQAKTDQRFEKLKAEMDGRFDKVDGRLDKMDGRLDPVERGLRGLRTDMPKIVGDAVREVQAGKPRRKS